SGGSCSAARWGPGPSAASSRSTPCYPSTMSELVRVLIADDDDLMRAGLKAVLSSDPAIELVGEAADGRAAIEQVRALAPDVVLMDGRMPDRDVIAAARE